MVGEATGAVEVVKTSAFNRKIDKRLVRQAALRAPGNWMPMNIGAVECKLMEVRKYSAPYHELNSKFRRASLELISAYIVQNPYLYGCQMLRKEQLKMQLSGLMNVKERQVYYPTTFKDLEPILKDGFVNPDHRCVAFFTDSALANKASSEGNPKVMVVANVLVGNCRAMAEFPGPNPFRQQEGYGCKDAVDTFVNDKRTVLVKAHPNEMIPWAVLVYRDKEGPLDTRSPRFGSELKRAQTVVVSYRSGTRYNPDEGRALEEDPVEDKNGKKSKKKNRSFFNFRSKQDCLENRGAICLAQPPDSMMMMTMAQVHQQAEPLLPDGPPEDGRVPLDGGEDIEKGHLKDGQDNPHSIWRKAFRSRKEALQQTLRS